MRALPLVALLAILAACGGGGDGDGERAGAPPPRAPAVTGATLDGEPFALASLRGKPVMLNAWASW